MNGHNGAVDLAQYLPKAPQDPRLSRTKIMVLDLGFITALLQLDGQGLLKMEGWPPGAIVAAWSTRQAMTQEGQMIDQLVLVLHHPDFPVVLGKEPPQIQLAYQATRLNDFLRPEDDPLPEEA